MAPLDAYRQMDRATIQKLTCDLVDEEVGGREGQRKGGRKLTGDLADHGVGGREEGGREG